MSWWYYAGPDAKPNGPVSLEELQARRSQGVILPDTYVIEHAGATGVVGGWRHYREVFPDQPTLPPLPGGSPPVLPLQTPPPIVPPLASHSAQALDAKQLNYPSAAPSAAHPLFPSAGQAPTAPYHPAPTPPAYPSNIPPHAAPHGHYPTFPTNKACAWGFGLGLAGFLLSFFCGVGVVLAAPAIVLCILGLVQVQYRRNESGAGLAICGGALAVMGLIISIVLISYFGPSVERVIHEQMSTQQSD